MPPGRTGLTCVGGGLLSVGLDLHAAGDSSVGLAAGQVGHVDEGVVESGQDVADAKCVFGLFSSSSDGGSEVNNLLLLLFALGIGALLLINLRLRLRRERSGAWSLTIYLLQRYIQ